MHPARSFHWYANCAEDATTDLERLTTPRRSPCKRGPARPGHDRSEPALVEELGAEYHTGTMVDLELTPDIVVECTGVVPLIQQAADAVASGGIVCLTGVGSPSTSTSGPASSPATDAVLKNLVLLGSVNANRRHYYRAAKVLAGADRSWLEQLLTRRGPPDQALARRPDEIKVVREFAQP
jgi:threonine dehydrogenase-like Zn-dependent dehydrogenase